MSLTISVVPVTAPLPEEIPYVLSESTKKCGVATLLCPSYDQAASALKRYAETSANTLGVRAESLTSWVAERWSLYGDGREPVNRFLSLALANLTMDHFADNDLAPLSRSKGTARAVSKLAETASGMVPLTSEFKPELDAMAAASLEIQEAEVKDGKRKPEDVGFDLSLGEAKMLTLYAHYEKLLADKNLIELTRAMLELPALLTNVEQGSITFWDYSSMTAAQRRLVCELARDHEVHVIVRGSLSKAGDAARALVVALLEDAELYHLKGARLRTHPTLRSKKFRPQDPAAYANPERNPELDALLGRLFSSELEPMAATSSVSLLEAAGPFAEAELVARHIAASVSQGRRNIAIATPQVHRVWRDLSPKLSARGYEVSALDSVPVLEIESVHAFMEFATTVAKLIEMDWPEPKPVAPGEEAPIELGEMYWWPPTSLTDFLLSEVSGVPKEQAWRLDKRWRGDRLLTPEKVLSHLQQASTTSKICAEACRLLCQGRVGSAVSRLASHFMKTRPKDGQTQTWDEIQYAGLMFLAEISRELGRAGYSCELHKGAGDQSLPLSGLLKLLSDTAEYTAAVVNTVRQVVPSDASDASDTADTASAPEESVQVKILGYNDAANLDPTSVDELILMGMTTTEMGVATPDSAQATLMEKLMIEPRETPLMLLRQQVFSALCAARNHVSVERALNDRDSKPTYPSVVLTELTRAFADKSLQVESFGEDSISENLAPSGTKATATQALLYQPTGQVKQELRPYVLLPKEGEIYLSASQIESYLECPYKWFSLRRLTLNEIDAGFSGMEKGTFVHRVLELTHKRLLCEAAGIEFAEDTQAFEDPRVRLEGSRITVSNLQHAQEVLDSVFDEHYAHQFLNKRAPQPLIPHVSSEEFQLKTLKDDLKSALAFETTVLEGFEPRYFELNFGGKDGIPVEYAGVKFQGSIDRVDVDSQGRAVIIDYKYKRDVFHSYAVADKGATELQIPPRHVQSMIYAQVLRRYMASLGLEAVGAIYFGAQPDHSLSGAVPESLVSRIWGYELANPEMVTCGRTVEDFHKYLDAVEEAIKEKIDRMRQGDVEANPLDKDACSYCPVRNCEKRLA